LGPGGALRPLFTPRLARHRAKPSSTSG
jgi:hypothetical protein